MSTQSHLAEPQMNATPLIDVLLVLLIMLIFTLPVATHAVMLNLPHGPAVPLPAIIELEVSHDGEIYWNGDHLASMSELEPMLRSVAQLDRQPLLKVLPERRTPYERVAQVLAAAQRARVGNLSVLPVPDY